MPRPSFARAAALALLLTVPAAGAAAQGAPQGYLRFTGSADATDLGRPGVRLDFAPQVAVATSGNTGSFATFNRRAGAAVTGSIADVLVGRGRQPIPNLLTVGNYRFSLAELPSGPFGQKQCYVAPAPGQRCTPFQSELRQPVPTDPLSPFYLYNRPSGNAAAPIDAVVAFNLFGTVTGPGGRTSPFLGVISTVFAGLSYQEVLGGLEGLGQAGLPFPGISFTGQFYATGAAAGGRDDDDDDNRFAARVADVSAGASAAPDVEVWAALFGPDPSVGLMVTPEPGTWALTAAGLAAVAGAARRRRAHVPGPSGASALGGRPRGGLGQR